VEPTTAQDWIIVAEQRLADAEAILKERPDSVGSLYMAGYAIECSLKAFLQKRSIRSPRHGSEGHNLRSLWQASKLRLFELQDRKGVQTFFLEEWTTDWRYEKEIPIKTGINNQELVEGAKKLSRWIQSKSRD
jgi:HEPN domain-containing protein